MVSAALFAILMAAGTQELIIPEGTILPVILNETLNTAKLQDNDPVLLTLAEDVRAAGHRGPILIPRGSDVVARVVQSERAGHFIGRAALDMHIQEIVTPAGVVYDGLSAKIIDAAKKKGEKGEVKADGAIQGPVHRVRDTFLLVFPPTTLIQLISLPKRGPDVVLPVETRLYVKLMSPIYVDTPVAASAISVPQPVSVPRSIPQVSPLLTPAALEVLVAPVAIYPDAVLRDLFVACTHTSQLVQASQWVHQPRDAAGNLPAIGYNPLWDQSVHAMTAYPDVLQRLTSDIDWTTKLGLAFSAQPSEVVGEVQRIRAQTYSLQAPSVQAVGVVH